MKRPNCDLAPVLAERQGVEIDYCPQRRGRWLDRGELDKIIERGSIGPRFERRRESSHKKSKRESLYGELFDL